MAYHKAFCSIIGRWLCGSSTIPEERNVAEPSTTPIGSMLRLNIGNTTYVNINNSDDVILIHRRSDQNNDGKPNTTTTTTLEPHAMVEFTTATARVWEMPFFGEFHRNGHNPTPNPVSRGTFGSLSSVVEEGALEESQSAVLDTDNLQLSPGAVVPLKMDSITDESFCMMCLNKVASRGNLALECNQHAVHSCMKRFHDIAKSKNKSLRCPLCTKN